MNTFSIRFSNIVLRLTLPRPFVVAGSIIIAPFLAFPVSGGEVPRLFREQKITAASFAEAVNHFIALGEDAAALRQSAAWQAIKWTDSGVGWTDSMEEEPVWDFIHRQAENIQ